MTAARCAARRAHPGRTLGRLTKRPEFLAAAAGRRFHTERMTLQGRLRDTDAPDGAGLRFGFTVTKKVGHATERNRIKRRLRAAALDAGASHADTPARRGRDRAPRSPVGRL